MKSKSDRYIDYIGRIIAIAVAFMLGVPQLGFAGVAWGSTYQDWYLAYPSDYEDHHIYILRDTLGDNTGAGDAYYDIAGGYIDFSHVAYVVHAYDNVIEQSNIGSSVSFYDSAYISTVSAADYNFGVAGVSLGGGGYTVIQFDR
jgi:hypothetical protein